MHMDEYLHKYVLYVGHDFHCFIVGHVFRCFATRDVKKADSTQNLLSLFVSGYSGQ